MTLGSFLAVQNFVRGSHVFQIVAFTLLLVLGTSILIMLRKRTATKKINTRPDIDDDDFVKTFQRTFSPLSDDVLIRERRILAKQLGIPASKLSSLQTLEQLSTYLDATEYSLAIGDLELALFELFEDAGIEKTYERTSMIGEIMCDIANAKDILGEKGNWFS